MSNKRQHHSPLTTPRARRSSFSSRSTLSLVLGCLILAMPLTTNGCTTLKVAKMAERALKEKSLASFVIEEDGDFAGIEDELLKLFGVETHVKLLENGARLLQLKGTYDDLVGALKLLIDKGFKLLASDKFSEALMAVVFSLLRAAA